MNTKTAASAVFVAGLIALGAFWHLPARGYAEFQDAAEVKSVPKRTIQTSGSATARTKPDHARVFLNVETTAATVKEARTQNSGHVNKVMAAIQALGIPNLKMKSTNMHMEPVYTKEEKREKLPQLLGYQVRHVFTVLVQNDDPIKLSAAASRVLDTALENGVNVVDQISFFRADLSAVRREALRFATEDALANAKAIAVGAELAIAEVIQLDGGPEYRPAFMHSNFSGAVLAAGDATSLVAGEIEVTCQISVTCRVANAKR